MQAICSNTLVQVRPAEHIEKNRAWRRKLRLRPGLNSDELAALYLRKYRVETIGMLLPGPVSGHGEQGRIRRRLHPREQARNVVHASALRLDFAGHKRNEHTRKEPDCSENLN
jgi:hypothetical protein